jgi:ribosomal protein S18 acetylase RimI-like enzyme
MNLTIRPITAADYAALWRVLEPMIRAGETYTFPQDTTEADAVAYWTGPDRDTFVAENDEGAIVGTYYIKANQPGRGDHVCNCGYVTAPEATGKGVARAMCAHSLEQAKARGFRAMQFNFVIATNTRAVALWHSLGFQTVGRLPGAYYHPDGRYLDALVMWRDV